MVSLEFFSAIILPVALWPYVFRGDKGGWCVRLTSLPPSCAIVMKSGNLNFLEPCGPLQACNGTALPLPFTLIYTFHWFLKYKNICESKVYYNSQYQDYDLLPLS